MSTEIQNNRPQDPAVLARQKFGNTVNAMAERELIALFGSDSGKQAASRVAMAFRSAAATAKKPADFYGCSMESVANAMATSAFTQIMPGGPYPGVFLVPKAGTLGWWITHRGIKTLARRAGQSVETIPYFEGDTLTINRGRDYGFDITEGDADRDDYSALHGVVVMVRDIASGNVLSIRKVTFGQIEKRRKKAMTQDIWKAWGVEMAEKTAIKYAAARGDIFFDDVGNMALSREAEILEGHAEVVPTPAKKGAKQLGTGALDDALAPAASTPEQTVETESVTVDRTETSNDTDAP